MPQLRDTDWLIEHYVNQGLSCREIGLELGCAGATVEYALKVMNIPRRLGRLRPDRLQLKDCVRCGKTFKPAGPASKFCSALCRTGQRRCSECGHMFTPDRLPTGQQAPSPQKY